MTLADLNKINLENVRAAGPRYTPSIDPNAPNLEIEPVIQALDAIGQTAAFIERMNEFESNIKKEWNKANDSVKFHFKTITPSELINSIKEFKKIKIGNNQSILKYILKITDELSTILDNQSQLLYNEQGKYGQHSEERRKIENQIQDLGNLQTPIVNFLRFTNSFEYKLISTNKLLILGEWGTGKTHSLCDITQNRVKHSLPTLFFLAQRLTANKNPLEVICEQTRISKNPDLLLYELNRLGLKSKTRTLIIIDAINEGNRNSWKNNLNSINALVNKYPNVGLVLSCRVPFQDQIFAEKLKNEFVTIYHNGFNENELDAQRSFFKYYKIPTPQIPLLTPEFSRPLFLKIMCLSFSGKTKDKKNSLLLEIASGQKGMTKLFEDFVSDIGKKIEEDFDLQRKTCWKIIKGDKISRIHIGFAVSMAKSLNNYLETEECVEIIMKMTGKNKNVSQNILNRLITEGLLIEDIRWMHDKSINVIIFPYQRFSDSVIARVLLSPEYLNVKSEQTIRRSFYSNRPLGKIFDTGSHGMRYNNSSIATAIMLEFPERVKKTMTEENRELVFYLPRKNRSGSALIDTFLDGILWRNKESFSKQTDQIFNFILDKANSYNQRNALENLVTLACRANHPYSSKRLYNYLKKMNLAERDLFWSEYLRHTYDDSVVHRFLKWVEDTIEDKIDFDNALNLITLLSLFLTSTNRNLRDKATKALVIIGEKQPKALFFKTIDSFDFDDPYVSERMLAASYGVLMRNWAFPSSLLKENISSFANNLFEKLFSENAKHSTSHILSRDYALNSIILMRKLNKNCLKNKPLKKLRRPLTLSKICFPKDSDYDDHYIKQADSAIHMDFENYTIGHLVRERKNYDYDHSDYQNILKQIKWRVLDLGYTEPLFGRIDSDLASNNFHRENRGVDFKVDRYGKKYSWIAYFEVAGKLSEQNKLHEDYHARISDCDIDPSFPEIVRSWEPKLKNIFETPLKNKEEWIKCQKSPDYKHLLEVNTIDNIKGPWILLGGYINEDAPKDIRNIFSFLNGYFIENEKLFDFKKRFYNTKYPGNDNLPNAGSDYYTFAGEIPWSKNFASGHFKSNKKKRQIAVCYERTRSYYVKKEVSKLTYEEKLFLSNKQYRFNSSGLEIEMKQIKSKFVRVKNYQKIPGIKVEMPLHLLEWESYHSAENQGGGVYYLAPAICDFLNLKNKNDFRDLVDPEGKFASLGRVFGNTNFYKSRLIYIRKDLLQRYLDFTKQKLIWIIWGERFFKTSSIDGVSDEAKMLRQEYYHIHKKLKVANLRVL